MNIFKENISLLNLKMKCLDRPCVTIVHNREFRIDDVAFDGNLQRFVNERGQGHLPSFASVIRILQRGISVFVVLVTTLVIIIDLCSISMVGHM